MAPLSGGRAQQLVMLCHGYNGNGDQQMGRARRLGSFLPNTAFLCPNGPEIIGGDTARRSWFQAPSPITNANREILQSAARALGEIVDSELERLWPLPNGYALLGFSQGADVILTLGLNRPINPPRALVAFATSLPVSDGNAPVVTCYPPTMISHGVGDRTVPIAAARSAAAYLLTAGVPVETLWLSGVLHTIDDTGLYASVRFLRRCFEPTVEPDRPDDPNLRVDQIRSDHAGSSSIVMSSSSIGLHGERSGLRMRDEDPWPKYEHDRNARGWTVIPSSAEFHSDEAKQRDTGATNSASQADAVDPSPDECGIDHDVSASVRSPVDASARLNRIALWICGGLIGYNLAELTAALSGTSGHPWWVYAALLGTCVVPSVLLSFHE